MAVRCLVKMMMMKMLVCVCVVLAGVVSRSAGVQGQMEEGSVNATVPGGIDELPEETQRDIDRFGSSTQEKYVCVSVCLCAFVMLICGECVVCVCLCVYFCEYLCISLFSRRT